MAMTRQSNANKEYPYPTRFGSHASMIDAEGTARLEKEGIVALMDENGLYVTERSRIDNGLADPNRYAASRLKVLID